MIKSTDRRYYVKQVTHVEEVQKVWASSKQEALDNAQVGQGIIVKQKTLCSDLWEVIRKPRKDIGTKKSD